MSDRLLSIRNLKMWLRTERGNVRAVDGVDLEVKRCETFALLGESGCGKSMTALSVMRLLPPSGRVVDGEMKLGDQDLLTLPEKAMRRIRGGRIAMIFQEPQTSLNPVLTVGDQIGEAVYRHRGMKGRALRMRVLELLASVGIPDPGRRIDEFPHQLSGGMKQRVMIAIALGGEPDLLIADEPTTALDVTIQAQVLALLKQLQAQTGMGILLITHDLGVVAEVADRVAVMYAGHIVEEGPCRRFFRDAAHPYSHKLFASLPDVTKRQENLEVIRGTVPSLIESLPGCRFEPRCDRRWDKCRSQAPAWMQRSQGHRVRCHLYDPEGRPSDVRNLPSTVASDRPQSVASRRDGTVLEVDDLKVHFPIHRGLFKRVAGRVRAVDGVSLSFQAGRTVALVGESGCGKTTVGKGILQLLRPTSGSVRFEGEELTRLSSGALRRCRRHLQIVFQDPYASMNPRMMIGEIVEEGMIAQSIGGDRPERRHKVDQLLRKVGLDPETKRRYPHEFSGGQRQRICIARALAVEPKVIVCDEPTSALDVSVQAQILNLLKDLQRALGLSYLFITHDISVVEFMAHEMAVMYLGRIVERGTVEELLEAPRHPYTQALLSAVPVIDRHTRRDRIRLSGELPSPADPPRGCHFHPRCPSAMPECRRDYPGLVAFSDTHTATCHLFARDCT